MRPFLLLVLLVGCGPAIPVLADAGELDAGQFAGQACRVHSELYAQAGNRDFGTIFVDASDKCGRVNGAPLLGCSCHGDAVMACDAGLWVIKEQCNFSREYCSNSESNPGVPECWGR